MQRNNSGTHAACAACKHQRKKCSSNCVLAPYFPASRNQEFQAVHKVFGVSNITKLVKNVKENDRISVVDSLVWEAFCRQRDPILGPYGEYKKASDKYKNLLNNQSNKITQDCNTQMLHLPTHHQDLKTSVHDHFNNNGWNNGSKGMHRGEGVVPSVLDYLHNPHQHKNNGIIDSTIYGLDFSQEMGNLRSEVVIDQFQQHHQPFYNPGNLYDIS